MKRFREIIAIIPARGGSKRVPGKNMRVIAGRPLIAHTIGHAKASRRVSRIYVSTDSGEIAAFAEQCGARIIRRPERLSTDTSRSEDALLHVLDTLKTAEQFSPDLVVFLQCTAPVRKDTDIDLAIQKMESEGADSLISLVRTEKFFWKLNESGIPVPTNYQLDNRPRSQELEPVFIENGSIYIFRPEILYRNHNRLGGKIACYEMSGYSDLDIDTESDLELAECILAARSGRVK